MAEDLLDAVIRQSARKGYTILNRTETSASVVEPKRFDPVGCLLLGFLPYILWHGLMEQDKTWYVEVSDGTVLWNGRTMEEIRRGRLVKDIAFAVAFYLVLLLCCWIWYTQT